MTDFGDLDILSPGESLSWMGAHPGSVQFAPDAHPAKGKPPATGGGTAKGKPKAPAKKGKPGGSGGHKHSSGTHGGHGVHHQGHAGKGHGTSHTSKKHKSSKPKIGEGLGVMEVGPTEMPFFGQGTTWGFATVPGEYVPQMPTEAPWTPHLATHWGRHRKAMYTDVAFPGRTEVGPHGEGHNAPRPGKHYADGTPVGSGRTKHPRAARHAGHPGHHSGNSHGGHHTAAKTAHAMGHGFVMMSSRGGHAPVAALHLPAPVRIHHGNHH